MPHLLLLVGGVAGEARSRWAPPGSSDRRLLAIRSGRAGGKPFAIAFTGYAQPDDREQAELAGFDAHLAKPASIRDLEALVARAGRSKF